MAALQRRSLHFSALYISYSAVFLSHTKQSYPCSMPLGYKSKEILSLINPLRFICRRSFGELNISFAAELFMWDAPLIQKGSKNLIALAGKLLYKIFFNINITRIVKKVSSACYCQKTTLLSDTAAIILHICCVHIVGHKNWNLK